MMLRPDKQGPVPRKIDEKAAATLLIYENLESDLFPKGSQAAKVSDQGVQVCTPDREASCSWLGKSWVLKPLQDSAQDRPVPGLQAHLFIQKNIYQTAALCQELRNNKTYSWALEELKVKQKKQARIFLMNLLSAVVKVNTACSGNTEAAETTAHV